MICKILGLLAKTLNADDKYSLLNKDNLMEPIQKQLSKKPKTFSHLSCAFFKCRLNFEHFFKKNDPHSLCIPEMTNCERRGCTND